MRSVKEGFKKEGEIARKLGGRKTAASGSRLCQNDLIVGHFSLEVKTSKGGVSITPSLIDRVTKRALREGKVPAIVISVSGHDWIAFRLSDLSYDGERFIIE